MDRERLKDVQTSDLKDDRLNEDFVVWLKTKGPTWLLMILVAVVAYLYIVNWKQGQINYRNEAWIPLAQAHMPTTQQHRSCPHPLKTWPSSTRTWTRLPSRLACEQRACTSSPHS